MIYVFTFLKKQLATMKWIVFLFTITRVLHILNL